MGLQNEQKVIGTLLQGLTADSLNLEAYNALISATKTGNYEIARSVTKNFFLAEKISKDNYDALLFVFVASEMFWG